MVDVEPRVNLIPLNPQVTAIVPRNDVMSDLSPLAGRVETLVYVSRVAKRRLSYRPSDGKVSEPLLECVELGKLGIRSNHDQNPKDPS